MISFKKCALSFMSVFVIGAGLVTFIAPQTVSAASNPTCSQNFIGFPVWYRGLTKSDTDCDIVSPNGKDGNPTISSFIWHIVLNVIEDAMIAVGYITAFFILYGGFQFLISQGAPDAAAKARTTILNAVIGLIISIVAVGAINFIVTGILK